MFAEKVKLQQVILVYYILVGGLTQFEGFYFHQQPTQPACG